MRLRECTGSMRSATAGLSVETLDSMTKIVEDFARSGHEVMEIVDWQGEIRTVSSCVRAFNTVLGINHLTDCKVFVCRDRIFIKRVHKRND